MDIWKIPLFPSEAAVDTLWKNFLFFFCFTVTLLHQAELMLIPSSVFRGYLNVCQLFCALILLCLHQVTVSSIVVFDHVFLSPDVAPVLCYARTHTQKALPFKYTCIPSNVVICMGKSEQPYSAKGTNFIVPSLSHLPTWMELQPIKDMLHCASPSPVFIV